MNGWIGGIGRIRYRFDRIDQGDQRILPIQPILPIILPIQRIILPIPHTFNVPSRSSTAIVPVAQPASRTNNRKCRA